MSTLCISSTAKVRGHAFPVHSVCEIGACMSRRISVSAVETTRLSRLTMNGATYVIAIVQIIECFCL